MRKKRSSASLEKILDDDRHTALFAGELSGKSYLLKRCRTVFAGRRKVAVILDASKLTSIPRGAEHLLADPFLVNVLRGMRKTAKSLDERLQLLDLLLCCGDDVGDELAAALKEANRLDVTFALYMRIVGIYYFRYHHDVDKHALRKLLKEIRAADKSQLLPKV